MNDELEFVSLTRDNARDLAMLDRECFSVPWSEKMFLDDVCNKNAFYVLVKHSNKLVAYGGMYKVYDEAQITNIAVIEEYRRKSIAKRILERIVDEAKKSSLLKISLEVRQSNLNAISLYENKGFKKIGCRKNYYHNPTESAILMELEL